MTNILILIALLAAVSMMTGPRIIDEWLGADKPLHFGASLIAGIGAALMLGTSPSSAFTVAMVPGILKECYDMRPGGSGWSYKDLVADAAGAACGIALAFVLMELL